MWNPVYRLPPFLLGTAMKIAHKFSYKSRSNVKVPALKQCATCDAFICIVGKGTHLKKYCSICSHGKILERARTYRENYPENCRQARHRRRARVKNAVFESFTLQDIISTHGTNCCECGNSIDLSLKWPHPRSKSEEHRVPISKGGSHTLSNVKLAHLSCNQKKSDKL